MPSHERFELVSGDSREFGELTADERAEDRRRCVDDQERDRPPLRVARGEHERHRVQAVREIVCKHRQQHDESDFPARLKADADGEQSEYGKRPS